MGSYFLGLANIFTDCIRTFTWDKKLESWVKDLTGGGRNIRPTVTSPKEYKHRFREAMERYILEAPRCVAASTYVTALAYLSYTVFSDVNCPTAAGTSLE